jgi:ABC-type multidrug transport system fused ATPase/permease subunit
MSGETIAIVGSTGAGKSTIINLLNRFMKLIGTICIDNENIENYTLGSKQIAVVLQDVFYLHTIFNITLNNPKKMFWLQPGVHDFI